MNPLRMGTDSRHLVVGRSIINFRQGERYFDELFWSGSCRSYRVFSPLQKFAKVVIDARDSEIRLTLEGPTHVVHAVRIPFQELDDGEDKILGLVEGVENFVLGDGNRRGARDAALHFQKT